MTEFSSNYTAIFKEFIRLSELLQVRLMFDDSIPHDDIIAEWEKALRQVKGALNEPNKKRREDMYCRGEKCKICDAEACWDRMPYAIESEIRGGI